MPGHPIVHPLPQVAVRLERLLHVGKEIILRGLLSEQPTAARRRGQERSLLGRKQVAGCSKHMFHHQGARGDRYAHEFLRGSMDAWKGCEWFFGRIAEEMRSTYRSRQKEISPMGAFFVNAPPRAGIVALIPVFTRASPVWSTAWARHCDVGDCSDEA